MSWAVNDLVDSLLQVQQDTEVGHSVVQRILGEYGFVLKDAIIGADGVIDDSGGVTGEDSRKG